MYPSTKFQSIWRNSDYATKFSQKKHEWEFFGKINIKIVIST